MTAPSPDRSSGHVWITGASSGIGEALALRMARHGWTVSASARRAERLAELEQAGAALPGRIIATPIDITDATAVQTAVRHMEAERGPLDIAVLNAGTYWPTPAATFDAADAERMIAVNLTGTLNCLAPLLDVMRPRGSGRIAIVASVAGIFGLPNAAAYTASKAGLIGLAQSLKPELDQCGITLQIVNPGFVRTPLTDKNEFPMPFLMELEDAAEAFYQGLQGRSFEIAFPRRMAWSMRLLRWMPYAISFAITRRMIAGTNAADSPSQAEGG